MTEAAVRRLILFCVVGLVFLFKGTTAATYEIQVGIGDLNIFEPANLTIHVNDTIRFVKDNSAWHNVYAEWVHSAQPVFRCATVCQTGNDTCPAVGSDTCDSTQDLWEKSIVFPDSGLIYYQCDSHYFSGMKGYINVVSSASTLTSFLSQFWYFLLSIEL